MLDLRQFAVLHAVRDGGSLSRAATTLHLSVPTVTHHLDAMERHLGTRLVERGPRGAVLTEVGEMFASDVEDVLDRIDNAARKVANARRAGVVTLRIGTFSSAGSRLLPAALSRLTDSMQVQLAVQEGEPSYLAEHVRTGNLDAALIYDLDGDPALDHPELTRHELDVEPFCVIASADGEFAHRCVDFTELADAAWVRSHDLSGAAERQLQRLAEAAAFAPRTLTRTDDYAMVHGLVADGLGLALVPVVSVDTRFSVIPLRIEQPLGARRVAYVVPTKHAVPAAVELGRILLDR